MKKTLNLFFCLLFPFTLLAQDIEYARQKINDLASPEMYGRGYVKGGDKLAADYLVKELKELGIKKMDGSYLQNYTFPVNTFPGEMRVQVGSMNLKPGYDFQIASYSKGAEGQFRIINLPPGIFSNDKIFKDFLQQNLEDVFVVIDPDELDEQIQKELRAFVYKNPFQARGYIILKETNKLSWSLGMSREEKDHTVLNVLESKWGAASTISLSIENKYIKNHKSSNVIGYLPGDTQKDSFVMITAHYDHLGMMGRNVCYCGAHDNASGVAMGLDLARYYAKAENRPEHSLLFVFFSGEEAGLHGSSYFAEHPVVDLKKVKFVMNIDLIGSGSKGIKVVNGSVLEKYFDMLKTINDKQEYIAAVKKRGEAANSDHYPLYAKGVPAFFVYTLGDEYTEYHNPEDLAEDLPLTAYDGLYRLIRDFVNAL